jgi:hypothetical protein
MGEWIVILLFSYHNNIHVHSYSEGAVEMSSFCHLNFFPFVARGGEVLKNFFPFVARGGEVLTSWRCVCGCRESISLKPILEVIKS